MRSWKPGCPDRPHSMVLNGLAAALNLVGVTAGTLFVLFPGTEGFGTLFGWILPAAVAATCVLCSGPGARHRHSEFYLAWTAAGFAILPFLLIARASFLGARVFAAASRLVILGNLGLGFLASVSTPRQAESEPRASAAGAASALAVGIAALAMAARFLAGSHPRTAGVLVPQSLPYWSPAFLAVAALAARSGGMRKPARAGGLLLALPAAAAAVLAGLPVYQVPGVLQAAQADFARAFGPDAGIPGTVGPKEPAFSLGRMFLGTSPGRVRSRLDVPYLSETTADGRSFTFRFDHWSPTEPGPHPVLVRIHGGGWNSGDKAYGNMNNVNRHFSSRGYAVFDLQYGLAESGTFRPRAPTPKGMLGPFGIEDMLRHLGAFSSYLADRATELDVDPARVFVSGASAGGHLALAVALAQTSGYARDHPGTGLDPRITVRGVIPFYPGIGYAAGMGIPARPDLDDLASLLGPGNPPALFYQGALDGMVDPARIRSFVRDYNGSGGGSAVLVEFPSAGHGSDLIFWNPYSQVFLHFMERFMAFHSD